MYEALKIGPVGRCFYKILSTRAHILPFLDIYSSIIEEIVANDEKYSPSALSLA